MKVLIAVLIASLTVVGAHAADRALANALASAGAAHAAKGDLERAKDQLYKSLANDETCPDAIFELAKIFDKEGNSATAGDFYQRASVLLPQDGKPATLAKRTEALSRVKMLNPFAPRISSYFEDYAQDLDKLVKKNTDTLTQESAMERVNQLKLSSQLTPDKMPKFYGAAQAEQKKKEEEAKVAAEESKKPKSRDSEFSSSFRGEKKTGVTAPDVEKELKAMGWAVVKGKFVKKAAGVYEVTDGRLEATKLNGGISFTVSKEGFKGHIKATVRSDFNDEYSGSDYTAQGYGFIVNPKNYTEYVPNENSGYFFSSRSSVEPASISTYAMPDTPKINFTMTVDDTVLEYTINSKRNNRFNNKKLPRTGPFILEVNGTATIEQPRAAGQ